MNPYEIHMKSRRKRNLLLDLCTKESLINNNTLLLSGKKRKKRNKIKNSANTMLTLIGLKSSETDHVVTRLKHAKVRKKTRHWDLIYLVRPNKWDHCLIRAKIQLQSQWTSTTTPKPQGNQNRSMIDVLGKTQNKLNAPRRNSIYSASNPTLI